MNDYIEISRTSGNKPFDETIPVFAQWLGSWQISINRRAMSEPELEQCYNQSSSKWNSTIHRLGFPSVYQSLLSQALNNTSPSTVLDCGVGTGALSMALTKIVPKPFELTGVDVSPEMLREAQALLSETHAKTNMLKASVRTLPFPDNSFDIVMTAHMLEHLSEPLLALDEMFRVLKPGGKLFACMTRRSLASVLIHLKWRTHRVSADEAKLMFRKVGLVEVEMLAIEDAIWCQNLSLACIGRKPL